MSGWQLTMERAQYLITRNRKTSFYSYVKGEFLLPVSATTNDEKPRLRVRTLLGHCLYRRVVIWTVTVLLLFSLTIFKTAATSRVRRLARLATGTAAENDEDRPRVFKDQSDGGGGGDGDGMSWLKYPQ
jgi:hypothetical protein